VAGVALGYIHFRFAWQAWHLWHWAVSGGTLGRALVARGAAPLCEAGVALGDIHLPFAWQAWHLVTSTFVSCGRQGTWGTGLAVAGVALADIQTSTFVSRSWGTGLALVARLAALCSPGAARHFAGQAWHLATSTFALHGRRGTWWMFVSRGRRGGAAPLCVAGVALGDIHLRFAWQAWHLVTSTFVSRGRRGTWGTGLALMARLGGLWSPGAPRQFAWQAWRLATSTFVFRGRRGTW